MQIFLAGEASLLPGHFGKVPPRFIPLRCGRVPPRISSAPLVWSSLCIGNLLWLILMGGWFFAAFYDPLWGRSASLRIGFGGCIVFSFCSWGPCNFVY